MESVIFEDSPLAHYLEGQGEGDYQWASSANSSTTTATYAQPSSPHAISFAPRGPPRVHEKYRRKAPSSLKLEAPLRTGAVGRLRGTLSYNLTSRLGRRENEHFLEQFRYVIVASQLLSEHANLTAYQPRQAQPELDRGASEESAQIPFSWVGLSLVGFGAFALAWSIHWLRNRAWAPSDSWVVFVVLCVGAVLAVVLYGFLRRQWSHYIRRQAIDGASLVVRSAQSFDAAASAAVTLIQEVEVVSRGYRIGSPLPPVTRFDERSQTRRCIWLRRSLRSSITSMLAHYAEAYKALRPLAVEADLEKYHDIYEISRTDVQEVHDVTASPAADCDEAETLQALKLGLQKLHLTRKLYLCSLLALDATSGNSDFSTWPTATDIMQRLSQSASDATSDLDNILSQEERFTNPPTPSGPITPSHARARAQLRKLSTLSLGIRSLSAKLHILREESDRTLDAEADEALVSALGANLMTQYDSIGADLRELVQEWEDGKAALATNIDRNEKRASIMSSSSSGGGGGIGSPSLLLLSPSSPTATAFGPGDQRSPTPTSLSGMTAVGSGSPTEALRILNGETTGPSRGSPSHRHGGSSSSGSDAAAAATAMAAATTMGCLSSDEEVFEAVAMPPPRQRSTLSREERIARMKEDRARDALARDRKDAGGKMLKELETVIRLRPRGRTTGRVMSMS